MNTCAYSEYSLNDKCSGKAKSLLLVLFTFLTLTTTPYLYSADPSVNTNAGAPALPVRQTERVDGRPSTAVISGGISTDGGSTTTEIVYVPSQVSINVSIAPEAEHIGKAGKMIVVVNVGSAMLALNDVGQLLPLDETDVPVFRTIANLEQQNHVELFSGTFAESDIGEFNIFTGYLVADSTAIGDIIYNVEPIHLKALVALPPPPPPVNAPPVVNILGGSRSIADTNSALGETVTLTASATDTDGTIVSSQWLVDGQVVATGLTASLSLSDGATLVTFSATDNSGSTSSTTVTITVLAYAPPVLTLFKQSSIGSLFGAGEFTAVSIPSKCELPGCSKTVNATLIGSNVYKHATFKLAAQNGDFKISSVTAKDVNGVTSASIDGLQAGMIISDGDEVVFTLNSGLTGGRQALLQWTIEVEGLGTVLIDTVRFTSN